MNKFLKYIFVGAGIFLVYLLYIIFQGKLIVPQAIHIGSFPIRYFGIVLALAVLAAYKLAINRASVYHVERNSAEDIIFWVIVGGFVGARIYHVLSSLPYYLQNPGHILMVWHGGLSIIGSLLGGLLILYLKAGRSSKIFLTYLDWLAPAVVLGQIIGRFADLFNYELFGYPTSLPWKMFVPEIFRPEIFANSNFFHPLFLYESLGNALILWILLKKVKPANPGKVFFTYLMSYGILRFMLEFLRIDSVFIGGLRLNAIVSLLFVMVSLVYFYFSNKPYEKNITFR